LDGEERKIIKNKNKNKNKKSGREKEWKTREGKRRKREFGSDIHVEGNRCFN
jgi:hypothetical protein